MKIPILSPSPSLPTSPNNLLQNFFPAGMLRDIDDQQGRPYSSEYRGYWDSGEVGTPISEFCSSLYSLITPLEFSVFETRL